MNNIFLLVVALSFLASPVLAWGEGGCSYSKKNKSSQYETIEKVDNANSYGR